MPEDDETEPARMEVFELVSAARPYWAVAAPRTDGLPARCVHGHDVYDWHLVNRTTHVHLCVSHAVAQGIMTVHDCPRAEEVRT
jgi:hypothetical protein